MRHWPANPLRQYRLQLQPWTVNPEPLLADLDAHPELWNQIDLRTAPEGSPHRELDDIWIRYQALDQVGRTDPEQPHESVWYPAVENLPALLPLTLEVVTRLEAQHLGGVLLTRIPPGGRCHPHVDGFWHANAYEKCAVQLRSHPQQAFHVETDSLSAAPGECYLFENRVLHWVENPSPVERITLIVCFRR